MLQLSLFVAFFGISKPLSTTSNYILNGFKMPIFCDRLVISNANGNATTRSFDEDNRMTAQSLGAATLTYDAASRLSKTIINGLET